ncbi:hypothetical protein MKW98_011247 [Papaver atlanticum]|uniref:Receptor-like serine/threonine-protein kinase n=1 Tax=Papaver atlanticum TaxID=357466 RepID=A0AAD4SVQ1_9MAGN|nr:hypothetical protein MKW98_011247 [Papaver atlanticum]
MGIERRRNIKLILPCLFTLLSFSYYINAAASLTVVSSGGKFKLGFFSLGNDSPNRYAGIWFNNIPGETIVWVEIRDKPLNDSSGVLKIADDGNLVVLDGRKNILWTSGVSNITIANTTAELMDTGNLVLRETTSGSNNVNNSGRILWESFDYASNVLLPGMKVGENIKLGLKGEITSFRDSSDPSIGIFSLGVDSPKLPQIVIKNVSNDKLHWRSGPWNNQVFLGIPRMYNIYVGGFGLVRDGQQLYFIFGYGNSTALIRFVLEPDGVFVQREWFEKNKEWVDVWHSQGTECDVYGKCGPFGSCNAMDSPICSCLQGFEPKSKDEWSNGNWSGGCVRRTELQCQTNKNASSTGGEGRKESDGFLKLDKMKVPDYVEWWESESIEECEQKCLNNCSCLAYSYEKNIGCMWWARDMVDIQKFGNFSQAGVQLHIKVANSELPKRKDGRIIITIAIIIGIAVIGLFAFICWRWMAKQRQGKQQKGTELYLLDAHGETSDSNMFGDNQELEMFNFETLANATNNFSDASKLGHGGFGSVYKAWKLWKESMAQALIDPTLLSEQNFEADILRCIHVGLLCVQESAKHRPTMSTVLSMLTSEIVNLPTPKQPAFIEREVSSPSGSSSETPKPFSVNNVTITSIEGR